MHAIDPRELGKLRWRCRRGQSELDELLRRYLDLEYGAASPQDQDAFRRLLESPDAEIHAYCLGRLRPPTAALAALIGRITAGGAAGDR
ncbi:MAG TPA: succinate dehydrogenase assembly factor 2 [Steroidobacteraceae bacterium]|nr:succinate dehydrogenase assembly factor 2 [Steroidobacteraceae bacterium]